jgi:NAD-dependent DNA ligase
MSIKDIYSLEKHRKELESLPGYGETTLSNIINSINSHKELPESVFLGAIGIEGFGQKRFKLLLDHFTYDEIIENCINYDYKPFTTIPGFQAKSARRLCEGIKDNIKLIEYLENKLILYKDVKSSDIKFKVVFTKVRDSDMEDFIKSKGGITVDNLTKDVNILVVPNTMVTSNKVSLAKKYGIDIIPIDNLVDYINERYI